MQLLTAKPTQYPVSVNTHTQVFSSALLTTKNSHLELFMTTHPASHTP